MSSPARALALGLLLALAGLCGCQAGGIFAPQEPQEEGQDDTGSEAFAGDFLGGLAPVLPGQAVPLVELGDYAGDGRVADLAAAWPDTVQRGLQRMAEQAGLTFPPSIQPRVVLEALGDEDLDHVVDAGIVEGRRVPVVRVNLEVLAPGLRDTDAVVAGALAAAVFEPARAGGMPPWPVVTATLVLNGELDRHLARLRRREAAGREAAVDPSDPNTTDATGAAALLLLQRHGEPADLRRFLAFAAEGDEPGAILARLVRDPMGRWGGAGRVLLRERLDALDAAPYVLLSEARRTLRHTGRAGLESMLPTPAPREVAAELEVLRARAYAEEGDYDRARDLLQGLDWEGAARLQNPAEASLLRIRTEWRAGGNHVLAKRLETTWRRDHPQRARVVPPLGTQGREDDLQTIAGEVEALLAEHRPGAARRRLAALGERALAPELTEVTKLVADAEADPDPASREVNRRRVEAWWSRADAEHADAVRDGGAVAAAALVTSLPPGRSSRREQAVRLAAEATGSGAVIPMLAATWRSRGGPIPQDLDAVLGIVPYAEVKVWSLGHAAAELEQAGGTTLWERLRSEIDEDLVRAQPSILIDLRSVDYARRRAALDAVAELGTPPPRLVARALSDPAALQRRRAAELTGSSGYAALAQHALRDDAWMVRQAACQAVAATSPRRARGLLMPLFRSDPAPQVRVAAGAALARLHPADPAVLDLLVSGIHDPDALVRDESSARLASVPANGAIDALLRALSREAAAREPDGPRVARLFLILQRVTGRPTGYVPESSPQELRDLLMRIQRTVSAERAAASRR